LELVQGLSQKDAEDRAGEFLKRFGLLEHAQKKPYQLSGGQQQRVALVRALAAERKLLLLDEPTSALDPLMTAEVLDLIMELKKENTQIIIVSHHLGFVKKTADWVAFLSAGKIVESGETESFFKNSDNEEKNLFLQKMLKY
jgi:polar amino acid transport system ATP-binding protein